MSPTKILSFVGGGLVVLALAAAGMWLMMGGGSPEMAMVKKDQYQTVFLSNGQVYFGKVKTINKDYVTLTNIYYLQVQQAVQPTDGKTEPKADDASSTQLVKLGNELHGPEDSMQINRTQVLFWENIKNDGKVAQAIKTDTDKK